MWRGMTDEQRLYRSVTILPSGCWEWIGERNEGGYGRTTFEGRRLVAHRAFYELHGHHVEHGKELHHKCSNPSCVNPEHLEQLTHKEHMGLGRKRPVHTKPKAGACPQGHPYEPDNLYMYPDGRRSCRTCRRAATKRHQSKISAPVSTKE